MPGAQRLTDQRAQARPNTALLVFKGLFQIVLAGLILLGAYVGYHYLLATKPEGQKRPPREQVYTVNMATVQLADHRPTFTVYGNKVAGDTVDLRVLVSGEIVEVHPELQAGHTVKAGDVLVRVDSFEYEGALTEARANLHVGGRAERSDLTRREREICEAIGPVLKDQGLIFVGIDVIGNWLTEINVTSPTGLQEIGRFDGVSLEANIWDAIEERHARRHREPPV